MATTELSVLGCKCLDCRIDERETMANEIAAWEISRNDAESTINWQFTTADARIKFKRFYPSIDD